MSDQQEINTPVSEDRNDIDKNVEKEASDKKTHIHQ